MQPNFKQSVLNQDIAL